MAKNVTLTEIANRIDAHLKHFEADPVINRHEYGRYRYDSAGARRVGRRVVIRYVNYLGSETLSKQAAEEYLRWLDSGKIGKHYQCPLVRDRWRRKYAACPPSADKRGSQGILS